MDFSISDYIIHCFWSAPRVVFATLLFGETITTRFQFYPYYCCIGNSTPENHLKIGRDSLFRNRGELKILFRLNQFDDLLNISDAFFLISEGSKFECTNSNRCCFLCRKVDYLC